MAARTTPRAQSRDLRVLSPKLARAVVALVVVLAGVLVGAWGLHTERAQRLAELQAEVQRTSLEISAKTLNGNLMGSVSLLGLIDNDIKREVTNAPQTEGGDPITRLSTLGNAFGAEGVFLVGEDGVVKSSWDKAGKPSTGLDVRFRPYFQMAMKGQTSVYAAVSMARGDRSLYFSAPVFPDYAPGKAGVGAVVARTDISLVDQLLKKQFDHALLISPQGVVFTATQPAWQGMVSGEVSAERLKAIRELKQFGRQFEASAPPPLPVALDGVRQTLDGVLYAVAVAAVEWQDPTGPWQLVGLANLDRQTVTQTHVASAALAMMGTGFLGWLWTHHLAGRRMQAEAATQLRKAADQQQQQIEFRARLAKISTRLQRCDSLESLAEVFLTEAREVLHAVQGALYGKPLQEPENLVLLGSSACAVPPPKRLSVGEGLLGQCAADQQPRWVEAPAEPGWLLRSGLGHAAPAGVQLVPLALNGEAIGVVEMAFLHPPDEQSRERIFELTRLLTDNLEILRRNLHTRELLDMSQIQADALRFQADELAAQQGEVRATESWYRAIIDSAPDGLLVVNDQGHIIQANQELLRLFGYQDHEVLGQPVELLLPVSARVAHVDIRNGFMREDDQTSADRLGRRAVAGMRKDGRTLRVEIALARLPAVGNRPACVCAAIRDVTERQALQDRLQALEARSRLILEAVGDGILGLDGFGHITFVNPAAAQLLGYTPDELLGQNLHEVAHHHHADGRTFPREHCRMYQTTVDGIARTVDDEVLWRKDGTPFAVEYVTSPITRDGRIEGTVVLFRDISDRKATESALQLALQVRLGAGA